MAIDRLVIRNFRNLIDVDLKLTTHGVNLLYGGNGSGKTSFLEAIYYLGHRRSLRAINTENLINYGALSFTVFGSLIQADGQIIPVGIERLPHSAPHVRIAGENSHSAASLAAVLPMRFINVHSHQLLSGPPLSRRKYLDWGLFYGIEGFQEVWLRFQKILQQRNSLLKKRITTIELAGWTQQLIKVATVFDELRKNYVASLLPQLNSMLLDNLANFFNVSDLTISYYHGWDNNYSYAEVLSANLVQDLERGMTHLGPHRADLRVQMPRSLAKDILSAGQQKLLVCAMMLAQGLLLGQQINKQLLYLIDDLPAELDSCSRSCLLNILSTQQAQVFITVVEAKLLDEILTTIKVPVKLFHVKHGTITEIN
jgi:DNA replication and repair protein RecF